MVELQNTIYKLIYSFEKQESKPYKTTMHEYKIGSTQNVQDNIGKTNH